MPSQRTLSSRWHDVFSARIKLACPESVASSDTVQTPRKKKKNETRDAG